MRAPNRKVARVAPAFVRARLLTSQYSWFLAADPRSRWASGFDHWFLALSVGVDNDRGVLRPRSLGIQSSGEPAPCLKQDSVSGCKDDRVTLSKLPQALSGDVPDLASCPALLST